MFGDNWSRGIPERRRPVVGRPRIYRRPLPRGFRRPDNAPRGRMSAYAFFIQTCREEHKQQNPGENIVFKEFSRRCADRWKTLNVEEKKHFSDMATQDRARYAKEMQSYDGPKIRNRRRKTRKDPRAPKRALSAFFWFCSDERPKVRVELPNASVGRVARELGLLWGAATPEVKTKYNELAVKDKERYGQQMEEYKKGNFSREVDGMEELPPPDPINLGKLPNTRRYTYHPPRVYQRPFLGHTIGMGQGSLGETSSGVEGGVQQEPYAPAAAAVVVDDDDDDNDGDEEDDEMVSDEEMEDDGSVIEDDLQGHVPLQGE